MSHNNDDLEPAVDDPDNESGSQKVGYGQPPKDRQFKPGISGNPKGRPKTQKKPGQALREILNESVYITEKGRRKKITKLEALSRKCLANAFNGDKKSLEMLIALEKHFGAEHDDNASIEELSKNDKEIIESYMRRTFIVE